MGVLLAGLEGGGGLDEIVSISAKLRDAIEDEKNPSDTHLHGVLVLAGEGVNSTLLDTLLTLAKALVPKDRWISRLFRDGEEDEDDDG